MTVALIVLGALVIALAAVLLVVALAHRRGRELAEREIEELRGEVRGLEHEREELERLAVTDPLTGVWNYRYLKLALDREVERAARFGRSLSLLMLDLDYFKGVNDRFGHLRGSAVLREFAQRVALEIRQVDTFARYGGEEFVLILPETGRDGAGHVAERICYAVRRETFGGTDEEPVRLTVSIGVAVHPVDGAHTATLLRRADEALYVAKGRGRDRWARAGDTPSSLEREIHHDRSTG